MRHGGVHDRVSTNRLVKCGKEFLKDSRGSDNKGGEMLVVGGSVDKVLEEDGITVVGENDVEGADGVRLDKVDKLLELVLVDQVAAVVMVMADQVVVRVSESESSGDIEIQAAGVKDEGLASSRSEGGGEVTGVTVLNAFEGQPNTTLKKNEITNLCQVSEEDKWTTATILGRAGKAVGRNRSWYNIWNHKTG